MAEKQQRISQLKFGKDNGKGAPVNTIFPKCLGGGKDRVEIYWRRLVQKLFFHLKHHVILRLWDHRGSQKSSLQSFNSES